MSGTHPRAASGASLVGEVLGSYRLIAELSSGGMGTVYRAQHELLGRPAAIKLLRPELSSNDVLVERFFNEAKAATAIRHPGIVEVYDFGYTDDGRAYIVMEFLDGETLKDRAVRRGRLTEVEAASIARGIASALKAAHAKGIVHRDLKPDNVFLVPDPDGSGDRVKVLDFGVAKLSETSPTNPRHTQTGVLMGTPLYMAPEQARAAGLIDHRADLYSLGCILYELLVGQPPFLAEGAGEIIAMQLFTEPQRPSERAAVSPEMEATVMRLLEKEPHDRFQSAADVQQALAQITAIHGARLSAELSAPGSSLPGIPTAQSSLRLNLIDEAPAPPPKKSALPIVAAVLTVVLAAAAGIFVMTRGGGDDEPAKPSEPVPVKKVDVVEAPKPALQEPPKKVEVIEPPKKVEVDKPKPGKRGDKGKPEKTVDTAGPVVKPSDTNAGSAASGPTTHTGLHTTEGAPIEPDLGDPVKKQPKQP